MNGTARLQKQLYRIEARTPLVKHGFVEVTPDWPDYHPVLGELPMDSCYFYDANTLGARLPATRTTARKTMTPRPTQRTSAPAPRPSPKTSRGAALAKRKAAAKAKAAKAVKRRGPPPWANAKFLREGDSKVSRALPPAAKQGIDRIKTLSDEKKNKLKSSPVSTLINMAKADPRGMASFVQSVTGKKTPTDNPALLASAFLKAAASNPGAAVKTAASMAMSGFGAIASRTVKTDYVGLAPAAAILAPVTMPVIQSIAAGKTIPMPSKKAMADAVNAANATAPAMEEATPPEAQAAAQAEASSSNLMRNLLIGAGVLGAGWLGLKVLRK